MLGYQFFKNGSKARADCLNEWFIRSENANGEASCEIVAVCDNYKDLHAIRILSILVDRHCPAE